MNDLKNYQHILENKASQVETFFAKYPEDAADFAKTFAEINAIKIRKVEPQIMIYGIYNAGKSSILNELIGEDRAKVEDKPTTDVVTYYEWQGYKIADTPGVFAPIKHEQVTQAHLKKSDIVLFVMSTTGSNEKAENYRRMKDIADAGKKIIIVLNDKNGDLGTNDDAIQAIKLKVAKNMKQVGIADVDEKYCIVTVNAELARQGRVENEPLFIEQSGLDELKNVMLSELKRTTSFDLLRNGIKELEKVLEDFIDKLSARENSELLRQMNHVLQTFNNQKISIRHAINSYIDRETEKLGATLPQKIWNSRDNQDHVQEIIAAEIEKLNTRVQNEIQRQLQDAATLLEQELKYFSEIKLDASTIDADSFKNILSQLNETAASSSKSLVVKNGEQKNDSANLSIATGLLTEGGRELGKQLAKTEIGKMLAKTTLGKIFSNAVPIVGPVITIVTAIDALRKLFGNNDDYEKLKAQIDAQNEANRRHFEAQKQAQQELDQKCRYLADDLADKFKSETDKSVTEILAKYEEPFKAEIAARKSEGEQVADDVLTLRELLNEYDLIRVELGAK